METFKKIMLWVAIIVIVFFVTNFCNFYIIASTYKDIDCKITNSNNLEIAKKECKATYVNGYCKLSVKNTSETRQDVLAAVDIFRSKIVDYSPDSLCCEITGESSKIEAFIELLRPLGIIEMCRTGVVALERGSNCLKACSD